ncbi:transposase [Streptomyces rochei]|uniref:transposase n=1 Tax=Streptomyces rochei TaxID=1928 RepID=UPI00373DEE8A
MTRPTSRAIRHLLRRRGIAATIPSAATRWPTADAGGASVAGHPPSTRRSTANRNVVERCFARLKQFRAIATRFDKLADRYRAGVVLAFLILWLREAAR